MLSIEYFVSCVLGADTQAIDEYKKVSKWHIYASNVQLILHFLTSVCPPDDCSLSKTEKWI